MQYVDIDTNQIREIDIVAKLIKYVGEYQINFSFVIECKSSKIKPWVAFMTDDNTFEVDKYKILSATSNGEILLAKIKELNPYLLNVFTNNSNYYAYSLVQALKNKDNYDAAYKGVSSINKAIEYYKYFDNQIEKSITFYIPILALEAKLHECWLNVNGLLDIKNVIRSKYLARSSADILTNYFIDIITREAINEYAENYKKVINHFVLRSEDAIKKTLKSS